jgi:hypothetical protein
LLDTTALPTTQPFHEYYSISTPDGYTREGCFVSTRRYDPMVGAVDARGSLSVAEKVSQKMIRQQEEAILLKGPEEAKRLLAPGQSSNSFDQYNKYWEMQEKARGDNKGMKEETVPMHTVGQQPKQIAQTRYMPLEVEHRDKIQVETMKGVQYSTAKRIGHSEEN